MEANVPPDSENSSEQPTPKKARGGAPEPGPAAPEPVRDHFFPGAEGAFTAEEAAALALELRAKAHEAGEHEDRAMGCPACEEAKE